MMDVALSTNDEEVIDTIRDFIGDSGGRSTAT